MTWLLWLGLAVCLLAVAVVGLSVYGSARWADASSEPRFGPMR